MRAFGLSIQTRLALNSPASEQQQQQLVDSMAVRQTVVGLQALAYTLRCLCAELDADQKPLFGAWSVRQVGKAKKYIYFLQQSTLYSLSRTVHSLRHSLDAQTQSAIALQILAPFVRPEVERYSLLDVDIASAMVSADFCDCDVSVNLVVKS